MGLCLLMVLVSLSAMVPPAGNLSSETPARSIYYTPQPNEVGLNLTSTGGRFSGRACCLCFMAACLFWLG